jgi:ribosomal protein S18 acetylase RimI-like enzyme
MAPEGRLTLRPVVTADAELLLRIYASTRAAELAQVPWTEAEKAAFVLMQHTAQDRYYREHFPRTELSIVLLDGAPVGRLYVDRRADEIRIIDIALLDEHRGAGIGTELLTALLEEARRADKPVRIHVERFNPALHLYRRLGFVETGATEVYLLMEWRARHP